MDKILILNVGSSSIKYVLYSGEDVIQKGGVSGIVDLDEGLEKILIELKQLKFDAVVHRVVHGGDLSEPVIVDDISLKQIEKVESLAPVHNPPQIKVIKYCLKNLNVPNVAVFDTAFHHTILDEAATYAIPKKISKEHSIKRYGFHGTAHKYLSEVTAKILGKNLRDLRIVTCHLGNGCSVTAVKEGLSIDTSMGFTPLEGLVMGTRSGDIDPAIIFYLSKMGVDNIYEMLNKESGLLGISGISNDMKELHESKENSAKLAINVFCHRLIKYIGAFIAVMNGADAIVFSGGIGENAHYVRKNVMEKFTYLGIKIDIEKNEKNSQIISTEDSNVAVLVIPADESIMMVREARRILSN